MTSPFALQSIFFTRSILAYLLSLVILSSPQIFMLHQGKATLRGREALQRLLVQSVLEDGFDIFVGVGLEGQGSGTSGLQTFGTIPFFQAEDPKTRPVPLFRMRAILQDKGEQFLSLRANGPCPVDETGGSPFEVFLVRFWHVLR
jgi:hypothetical protein